MQQASSLSAPNTRWFVRFDRNKAPGYLTLYTFIGAKFEAHHIFIHSESIGDWIERTYSYPDIREVFEYLVFDPGYPTEIFDKVLPKLCRLRDQLRNEKSRSLNQETAF